MVNESEQILEGFSEIYFYKELVISQLKFISEESTEKEVADLVLNFGDIILAIQLKGRNEKDKTQNIIKENKWPGSKCKKAKEQIKDSVSFIRSGSLPGFVNARENSVMLNNEAEIIPLVIFMNDQIKEYPHVLRKHSDSGMDVNCMSYNDFMIMCNNLITPIEIIDYLKWRLNFYIENGDINMLFYEDEEGNIAISRPQSNEALVRHFISIKYKVQCNDELRESLTYFSNFLHLIPEHTVYETESNANYSLIMFFAHLRRDEIILFVERLKLSIETAKAENYGIKGTIRNVQSKYAMVFVSSKEGNGISMDLLYDIASEKENVENILQIIVFWENDNEYRVDFLYNDYTVR